VLNEALTRVTNFVVGLTPIGIFAIAASASGTLSIEEFGRLQIYLILYMAITLVVAFWILPGLVTALTPLSYRDVVIPTRDAMITAFMTGSLFVVLPILAEKSKELLRRSGITANRADEQVDVIIPASFNFPHTGKLLSLSFVSFAGWFSDAPVTAGEYPPMLVVGLVTFFGKLTVAIPYLLDMLRIPADTFQLFLVSGVINSRFGTLMAAMHTLVLALLGACAIGGALRFQAGRILRYGVISVLLLVATVGGAGFVFSALMGNEYEKDKVLAGMQLIRDPTDAVVLSGLPAPPATEELSTSNLARIRQRGSIRVSYVAESLPYAFFNGNAELVGFDVDMAHQLARELGVRLELVPLDRARMHEHLDAGVCDIVMSGLGVTTERAARIAFSVPYVTETLGFAVRDHRRNDFSSRRAVQALEAPRIAAPNLPYYVEKLSRVLPHAEVVLLDSVATFYEDETEDLDAMLTTAERGSAWSLLHPQFTVVVPRPGTIGVPLAYATRRADREFVDFINTWIELKRNDGTIRSLHDYWVRGIDAAPRQPRWSVIRDVLHWID
jgi:ABC-type amino acid transport substrate-binding protein